MKTQVLHRGQHPYKHKATEIMYNHDGNLETVSTSLSTLFTMVGSVITWQSPVATYTDLPITGNTINEARMVNDDGDAKPALYVCVATSGSRSEQWLKLADVDWGALWTRDSGTDTLTPLTVGDNINVGNILTNGNGVITQTVDDVDFYVNQATGSDSNPGTSALPFETIQHAIDSVADTYGHTVSIHISAHTYTEAVSIKQIARNNPNVSFKIMGTAIELLDETIDVITNQSVQVTGASWTTDIYKDKILRITGGTGYVSDGEYINDYAITGNTADTLSITNIPSSWYDNTTTFKIVEPGTTFDGNSNLYCFKADADATTFFEISNVAFINSSYWYLQIDSGKFIFHGCSFIKTGSEYGVGRFADLTQLYGCVVSGNYALETLYNTEGYLRVLNSVMHGQQSASATSGSPAIRSGNLTAIYGTLIEGYYVGLRACDSGHISTSNSPAIDNCAYAMRADNNGSIEAYELLGSGNKYLTNAFAGSFIWLDSSNLTATEGIADGIVVDSSSNVFDQDTGYTYTKNMIREEDDTRIVGDMYVEGNIYSTVGLVFIQGDVDLYIATTGNDTTGDGTLTSPWATPTKLITEMARHRSNGTITGHIGDGTYTNPTPTSNYLEIPSYAIGDFVLEGNTSTPANVIIDGGDPTIVQGRALIQHQDAPITLKLRGMTLRNATSIIANSFDVDLSNVNFYNYRYSINSGNGAKITAYSGSGTLNFDGNNVPLSTAFRLLEGSLVNISQNVVMQNHFTDFGAAGVCQIKLQSSGGSTYTSTMSATVGSRGFALSRGSFLDINMPITFDGNNTARSFIELDGDSKVYSFGSLTHNISNCTTQAWKLGSYAIVEEPVNSTWNYTNVGNEVYSDYSAIINSADDLDSTPVWFDSGVTRGYDSRYERMGENYTPKVYAQSATPTTAQIAEGEFAMWTDTDDSKCYMCYNHGGTIKTVELT